MQFEIKMYFALLLITQNLKKVITTDKMVRAEHV